ncbi:hypothetical protein JG687_00002849, partial [Phytophthora cactorum]
LALKTLIETLDIATKEAQKPQIGEEANSFQSLKDRWSSRRNTDEVLPASKTGLPNLHDPGFFRCR